MNAVVRSLVFAAAQCFCAWAAAECAAGGASTVSARGDGLTLFDGDPQHPWNRLHQRLFRRVLAGDRSDPRESFEPPFLSTSKFLSDEPSHSAVLGLLDAVLNDKSETPMRDARKRAILQRDLWAVFAMTVSDAQHVMRLDERSGRIWAIDAFEDPGDYALADPVRQRRRAVQERLVQVMRKVALRPAEIASLADNLAETVTVRRYPREFDPSRPEVPFLPADLLADGGAWISVTNRERGDQGLLAAPEHALFTKCRSVFVTQLRLPGGRRETEEYLATMGAGGELKPFPNGTQTALVRRMLLIDDSGQVRESPLIESVQLRVYPDANRVSNFEFLLNRGEFVSGRGGGLRAVEPSETSYFDFQTRGDDVFETSNPRPAGVILQTCNTCHTHIGGRGGIDSVNTVYVRSERGPRSVGLSTTTADEQADLAIRWLQTSFSWGLLQGMWTGRTGR